jgi:hypothetical protein
MKNILALGMIVLLASSVQLGVAQPQPVGDPEISPNEPVGKCAGETTSGNACRSCCAETYQKFGQQAERDECIRICNQVFGGP